MVMPSSASATMLSSTSLTISGSSAEVGSSNNMIFGDMHSARAIATRCCWPPESWPGYLSLWAARPTRSRRFAPFCVDSSGLRPCAHADPRAQLREVRFRVADRDAVDRDFAFLERLQAVHALDQRRFSAPGRPA